LFDTALDTAIRSEISAVHRIAASDLLCGLLERCGSSPFDDDHSLLWDHGYWQRSFQVFLERSDHAKAKSTRQLLAALTTSLRKGRERSISSVNIQDGTCRQLVGILLDDSDQTNVKPALQLLANFLSKDILPVDQLLAYVEERPSTGETMEPAGYLFSRILAWVPYNELSAASGHLVGVLIQKLGRRQSPQENGNRRNTSCWVERLAASLKKSPEALQNFKNYIFPELFTRNIRGYLLCLEHMHFPVHLGPEWFIKAVDESSVVERPKTDDLEEAVLLFSILQAGKEMGLVREAGTSVETTHGMVLTH